MALTLDLAERLIAAAEEKARAFGIKITIAVVDDAGFVVVMRRMDGTRPMTTHIANSKAYTAAIMKRPSRDLLHWAESEPVYFGQVARMGHLPIVATLGGVPVKSGADIIGGIGVSGGSPQQDQDCCDAALAATGAA